MVAALISDDFWNLIAPLLPRARFKPKGGRPRIHDRACLRGILFVLRTNNHVPSHFVIALHGEILPN